MKKRSLMKERIAPLLLTLILALGVVLFSGSPFIITAYAATDTTKPTISNIKVTDITPDSYKVTCTVSDNVGVTKVLFPTWTESNGQDDIVWHVGTISGSTASFTVKRSAHKSEYGKYNTHIYAYDAAGNSTGVPSVGAILVKDTTKPTISNIKISNVTQDSYKVTCTVSDNVKVTKVLFPTWTEKGGQDDIVWHVGTISGNTASYTVKRSAHNNEYGKYVTHIYAYDAAGNSRGAVSAGNNFVKDTTKPTISNVKVTDVTADSYTVTCTVSDNVGVTKVYFPTWTENGGHDDETWHVGTISGSTASFTVKRSEHNKEYGTYNTHIYAYDAAGNSRGAVSAGATLVPTATDVAVVSDKGDCRAMQGMAVGSTHIYSVKISSDDSRAALVRTRISDGYTENMINTADGSNYFTTLDHANDLTVGTVNGTNTLFVATDIKGNGGLIRLEYSGKNVTQVGSYTVKCNGTVIAPTGVHIISKNSTTINFMMKNGRTYYTGSMSASAMDGTIEVTKAFTLNVSNVKIDGKTYDLSSWTNQGFAYYKGTLFVPMWNGDNWTENVILVFKDIDSKTGSVSPTDNASIRVVGSDYAFYEIEACGIHASTGRLYFNTNRNPSNWTNLDGIHYVTGYTYS